MNKLILVCSILLFILPSSAQLETHGGFPVNTGYTLQAKLVTADLDGDKKFEIIAATDNRKVLVFNKTGRLVWENVSGIVLSDTARVPVARNLSGDSLPEVLTYGNPGMSDSTFYIWDAFGNKITEMMVGNALILSSPSVTKDGIILTAAAKGKASVIINGTGVHAFDTEGNRLWYLELGMNASTSASIPLADLDGDGQEEAVILTQDVNGIGKVWAIKVNRTQGSVLWNKLLDGDARKVAVGDLNNDSRNEIVVLSTGGTDIYHRVYILDRNGNELNSFEINTNSSATPAIGDLEGDGINDVAIASHSDKKIYIISNDSVRNFSSTGRVWTNVALGDINADGKLEIVAGEIDGSIYIWDINGTQIDMIRDTTDPFTSALITDLDRDGNKELILGNINGYIYVYTYRIMESDLIFPVTSDDADGVWHNSTVTVTLTAIDTGSGIADTYYTIDGSIPTTESPRGNIIIISSDGIYNISYFSVDYAGNVEPVKNATNQVKIDTTPPSTSNNYDDMWHAGTVSLDLTPADNLTGVAFLYYSVNGVENISTGNVTLTFMENGVHTVEYYGIDNIGNRENTKNVQVKIDNIPPVTADNSNESWQNTSVTVRLSANDPLSGVNATYNKVTSVPLSVLDSFFSWLAGIFGIAEGYVEGDNVTLTDEGIYVVTYFSNDRAGNTEAENVTGQVRIDKTLPTTAVTVPINKTYLPSESITLAFSANDDLSGIKSISGSIDGIRPVSSGEVLNMGTLSGGGHEFILTAEDNATNINTQTILFNVAGETLQAKGYVNGTVRDNSTTAGISRAKVIVTQTGMMTEADDSGNYSLYLDAGTFNLTVTKEPEYYQNISVAVTVNSSQTTPQDINLTKKPAGTITGKVANN